MERGNERERGIKRKREREGGREEWRERMRERGRKRKRERGGGGGGERKRKLLIVISCDHVMCDWGHVSLCGKDNPIKGERGNYSPLVTCQMW